MADTKKPSAIKRRAEKTSAELVPGVLPLEAVTAIDGLVAAGLEGNLGGTAASIAYGAVHLTGGASPVIASAAGIALVGAAGGAAARLVGEAFFREESLFRSGEGEFCAAVTAYQGLVGVHG